MTPKQAAQRMRDRSHAAEQNSDRFGPPPKGYEKLWKIPHEFELALADILEQKGVTQEATDEISLIVWTVIQLGAEFDGRTFDDFMADVRCWDEDNL